jgi:glutathione S-transferase
MPAREYPHIAPFLQRMLERPALQRVIAAEQLAPPLV